jgi:large repetitive protein
LKATADAAGNFSNNSYIVQESDLGVAFTVTATGDKGSIAHTKFTDAVNTTTTLTSSVNPSVNGQSVTFTATVAPASGVTVPTGTVQFLIDGVNFGAAVSVSSCAPAPDACATSGATTTLSVANHVVTANYVASGTVGTGTVTFTQSSGPNNNQTITVGGVTYTWKNAQPPGAVNQIFFSNTAANAAKNLVAAIMGNASLCGDTNCINAGQTANASATATAATNVTTISNTTAATITFTASSQTTYTLAPNGGTIAATTFAFNNSTGTLSGGQVVNKANTTTTITNAAALATASNAGVAYPVNYSVAVTAPGVGTPTGTVTVSDGTGATCTGTPAAGTCSLTSTTAGAKTITAAYGGDTSFNTSTSTGVAHTVNVAPTTTGLVSSANPSVVGQSVTFTATVAPIPTTGDTVTFKDGATTLGTGTTNASGVATFPTAALTIAGSPHSITAVFAGDASYSTSTSTAVSQVVNKAATTTTVSAGTLGTATVVGQAYPVAFTVAVTAPGGGTITGSDIITVSDGIATCTATITAGTCNLTSTSAGTKSITAAFPGDASYNASTSAGVSHVVNKAATSTTITTDLSAATVVGQPYTVAFTVAVTAPGAGTIPGTDTVTVSDGVATCSGTITAGSCSLTSTTAGAKTITASFVTDANFAASSSTGTPHTVSKAATTTTITSDLSGATNAGQAYTVAYTVAAVGPGAGTATGNVTVSDGTNSCTATVAAGSCSLTSLTAGAKTIVATYAGDTNFLTSASAGTPHTVNIANTTTTLVSGTNPSTVGGSVTFTATVAPIPATGSVITFKDGAATIGTGNTSASGVATLAITSLTAAASPHSITASFPGDANFNASTSNTISQVVNKANPTNAITSDLPDPSVTGGPITVNFSVTPVANGPNPTGTVTVTISGSAATCNGALTAGNPSTGTCNISPTTVGAQTLTATYSGDGNYNAGTAATTAHTVSKASTTTAITTNLSTPTNVGVAYTVAFTVSVTSPGTGTPTGTVTVSDGTATCTATVAVGSCSLTSTTAGTKTITATYPGDTNFLTSTSTGVTHQVNAAPVITSANNTTFKVLTAGTFTVTATGTPAPTFSETGALPSGVTLATNGTLSGTPASGTVGTYPIVITATNGVSPDATQSFTLTVGQAPAITSPANATFIASTPGSFQVTATGSPAPTFAVTAGVLPSGLTMTTAGLISGSAAGGQTQVVTITASNGITPNATQSLTIQVNEAPAINDSTTSVSYALGSPASFTFTLLFGTPATATWTETGALPAGMTLSTAGVLSGTPTSLGVFPIVVTADNGVPPAATLNFTISVGKAVASQQPFNTGHGWTWTRVSCTTGLGGSCTDGTNDTTAADCIGNTGSCVQVTAASFGTATFAGYFHNTYTWVQLGVPSGATVVSVAGNFWDKSTSGFGNTCTSGTTVGMDIFDAANTTEVVAGAVNSAPADGDTSGFTHPNSTAKTVIPAAQGANTTVTLRFNFNLTATFTTCKMTGDNYNLLISYIPINQHQVIVASVTIDRYGRVVGSIPLKSGAESKSIKLATE